MNFELLSRRECQVMRGVAILAIVLHNYCHWLGPIVKENEYTFAASNAHNMLMNLFVNPDGYWLMHFLSFFGHYGVPVFLFLSAYGLVMKYERQEGRHIVPARLNMHAAWTFSSYHWLKLFRMMIVGFVAFTMIDAITPGAFHYSTTGVVAQLLLLNNLLPSPDKVIWPGPYWFFGLMLQLYVVYRLLLYRTGWKAPVIAIAACWIIQLAGAAIGDGPEGEWLNYIRYNCVGGILPFGLGLLYARYGRDLNSQQYGIVLVVSIVAIVAFSLSYMLWYLVPALICVATVALVKILPRVAGNPLEWIGTISAAMFVCHPITRKIFIPFTRQYFHSDPYMGLLLYVVSTICLAWAFKELMRKVPRPKSIS